MIRLVPLVLLFAAAAPQGPVDREKLELIRRMSPEERAALRKRLEEVKALPAAERERLSENLAKLKSMPAEEVKRLREKAAKLSKDEFREYSELAVGFFAWARRMGYHEGFPRGLFFAWLRNERPDRMREIRSLEPGVNERGMGSPRVDAFIKLHHEFREVAAERAERHASLHRCAEAAQVRELREATGAPFWPKFQELQRACQAKRAAGGVPVRTDAPRRK